LEKRCLAEARKAEEDGEPAAQDEAQKLLGLGFAAVKEVLVLLAEGGEARPGVVGVDRAGVRRGRGVGGGIHGTLAVYPLSRAFSRCF
jgi:hypothetical protein